MQSERHPLQTDQFRKRVSTFPTLAQAIKLGQKSLGRVPAFARPLVRCPWAGRGPGSSAVAVHWPCGSFEAQTPVQMARVRILPFFGNNCSIPSETSFWVKYLRFFQLLLFTKVFEFFTSLLAPCFQLSVFLQVQTKDSRTPDGLNPSGLERGSNSPCLQHSGLLLDQLGAAEGWDRLARQIVSFK